MPTDQQDDPSQQRPASQNAEQSVVQLALSTPTIGLGAENHNDNLNQIQSGPLDVTQPLLHPEIPDDLDILWGDSELGLDPSAPAFPLCSFSFAQYGISDPFQSLQAEPFPSFNSTEGQQGPGLNEDPLSRNMSRLPSLQPEDQPQPTRFGQGSKLSMPQINRSDYAMISSMIHDQKHVLPPTFHWPSRHALSRYLEGFFNGFYDHLPFLHLPTFALSSSPLMLILAIFAMGAQFRFEREEAIELWKGAKALIDDHLRRRANDVNAAVHTPLQPSFSPSRAGQSDTIDKSNVEPLMSLETIQAIIIVLSFATWNHKSLLRDAYTLATELSFSLRQGDFLSETRQPKELTWEKWIEREGRRRTILVSYFLLNLHSVTYNIPPRLVTSEIRSLNMPFPEEQWRAGSSEEWRLMHRDNPWPEISIGSCFDALFSSNEYSPPEVYHTSWSSFGNITLVHSLFQLVYISRELCPSFLTQGNGHGPATHALSHTAISVLETALRRWQLTWESSKESSVHSSSLNGPLAFNSTAIFRIAYIRLHFNIGPFRQLQTHDATAIAEAFRMAPHPTRSPEVNRAVLQSVHSLSILIREGIEFVSRTQTLTWSIVHSLCNLECAIFLSKWIETIQGAQDLHSEERRLMSTVESIIAETKLIHSVRNAPNETMRRKQLSVAVIQLLVETLKGTHVFELADTFYTSLKLYANMINSS
jgi:hypothetical protein